MDKEGANEINDSARKKTPLESGVSSRNATDGRDMDDDAAGAAAAGRGDEAGELEDADEYCTKTKETGLDQKKTQAHLTAPRNSTYTWARRGCGTTRAH